MTRVRFVSARSPAIAQLAQERYERRRTGDAKTELVVDVDDWGLADPVGICAEELRELHAAIDARLAEFDR